MGHFFFFFQNCFFFVQSESLWLCGYFLYWVFYFNSFFVVKMTVWNTMFRMSTMPCLPTLIGTTLRWRVLPSKLVKLNHSIFIFYNNFLLQICVKFMAYGFFVNRFFKESSEEERDHAEKFMEYQVFDLLFFIRCDFVLIFIYVLG